MERVAIITGAADGIGKASTQCFMEAGYRVVAVDKDADKLQQLSNELPPGSNFVQVCADVNKKEEIEDAVKIALEKFGRIDVLVNNAGGGLVPGSPTPDELDVELWDDVVNLNLYSVFNFTQAVLPSMIKQKYGRIVCVTSVAGRGRSLQGNVAYSSSKAAVNGFARHASKDLGPHGITINCVAPGMILTGRAKKVYESKTKEKQQEISSGVVVNRLGQPMDVGRLVYFLGAEDAGFITGAIMDVNGGVWVG